MAENYSFKTDRDAQWALLEAYDREDGRNEESIAKDKYFFFNGFDDGDWRKSGHDHVNNLGLYPHKTIQGWEEYFSHFKDKPLTPIQVLTLQRALLSNGVGRAAHPHDNVYYIKELWGEIWQPDAIIKIKIPTQEPIQPLDPNYVYSGVMSELVWWLKDTENKILGSYLEFMPRFLDAVPPLLDARIFDFEKYKLKDRLSKSCPLRIASEKSRMQTLARAANGLLSKNDVRRNEKIALAKNFFDVFNTHSNKLGPDFPRFVAEALEAAKQD